MAAGAVLSPKDSTVPAELPADFNGWDKAGQRAAPPAELPADFSGWDKATPAAKPPAELPSDFAGWDRPASPPSQGPQAMTSLGWRQQQQAHQAPMGGLPGALRAMGEQEQSFQASEPATVMPSPEAQVLAPFERPRPLTPAEQEFHRESPETELRPVGALHPQPAPRTALDEQRQTAAAQNPALRQPTEVASPAQRLAQPATPQQIAARTPVQPLPGALAMAGEGTAEGGMTPTPEQARTSQQFFDPLLSSEAAQTTLQLLRHAPMVAPASLEEMPKYAQKFTDPKAVEAANQAWDASHPGEAGFQKGVADFLSSQSSPFNAMLMAGGPVAGNAAGGLGLSEPVVGWLSRALSGFFAGQAAYGSYGSAREAFEAYRRGDNAAATRAATNALFSLGMGALAAHHAITGGAEAAGAEHPSNLSKAGEAPVEAAQAPEPMGATEAETGRTVMQQSPRAEVTQAAATAEHPAVKDRLTEIAKDVPGAEIAGARDEKDAGRLEEKMEAEGQSPRTVRDYSGFRISVDSPAAKDRVEAAIAKHFEIVDKQDEWEGGNGETGFHGLTLQVREPGSPVSHEVQVLPREVAQNADSRHNVYEKAREGDKDAGAELKAANEADWQRFQARNAQEGGRGPTPEQPAGEPKFKFGSTQANIPAESEAAQALKAAREKIAPEDRAADVNGTAGGLETQPHVTVRYGLKGGDTAGVRRFIESQAPFEATLGKTESFPPSEHSDGAATVMAPVEAPELRRIEAEIEKHGDFAERSFPEYRPHATLGYVKPETAPKYEGMGDTEGKRFTVRSIAISDRDGNLEEIPLKGKRPGEATARERFAAVAERRRTDAQRAAAEGSEAQRQQREWEGRRVALADGSQGTVEHFQPAVNGAPARARVRLDDGRVRANVKPEEMRAGGAEASKAATGREGVQPIGEPIGGEIADLVKQRIAKGEPVKIFSRRVSDDPTGAKRRSIEDWTEQHFGARLPVTDVKGGGEGAIYDDSSNVEHNTGRILAHSTNPGDATKPILVDLDGTLAREPEKAGGGSDAEPVRNGGEQRQRTAAEPGGAGAGVSVGQPERAGGEAAGAGAAAAAAGGRGSAGEERAGGVSPAQAETLRGAKWPKNWAEAKKRTAAQNAAAARPERVTAAGRAAAVLDADSAALWHRVFAPFKSGGRNELGAGVDWKGITLSRRAANAARALLREHAAKARAAGHESEAAGYDRVAEALAHAVSHGDGSATVLRGDYREDTAREEAWHAWALKNHVFDADALRAVADMPEVAAEAERLRGLGYGRGDGEAARLEIAHELLAKAMAGDPDAAETARVDVATAFAHALVDEYGHDILEDLPPLDAAAGRLINEAKGADHGREYDQRIPGGGEPAGAEADRGNREETSRGDRGTGPGGRASEPGSEGQPGGGRGLPGVRGHGEEEGELNPRDSAFYQRQGKDGEPRISAAEAWQAFKERAAAAGIKVSGAFLPYDSNYMKIEEPLPRQLSGRGYVVEPTVRFSNHGPANYRPTFGNWMGGTRADFEAWSDRLLQDIDDLRSGRFDQYEDRKFQGRMQQLQASADYWRSHGSERNAAEIERDIGRQQQRRLEKEKPQSAAAETAQAPEEGTTKSGKPSVPQFERERAGALAEAPGNELTRRTREPLVDISRAAGRMEREAPLFFGTGEHPTLFQRDREAEKQNPWYLKSERVVAEKMRGPMPAADLARMLRNNGVGAEEMKWTGLDDFLTQKGNEKVTAPEVAQALRDGAVKVEDAWHRPVSDEEMSRRIANGEGMPPERPTRYHDYVEPGGENYRELLLTTPKRGEQEFQSTHWHEPNVLAHVRMNDRTLPDGGRALHLEELQSDWHQIGRKKGYRMSEADVQQLRAARDAARPAAAAALKEADDLGYDSTGQALGAVIGHPDWAERWDVRDLAPEKVEAIEKFATAARQALRGELLGGALPPEGPFAKDWQEMALRRMVQYAAENGYDALTWTPGELQGARYPEDMGGPKDAARLEGMKGFYNKIVPDFLNKFAKKFGARVGDVELARPETLPRDERGQFAEHTPENTTKAAMRAPMLPITEEMRRSLVESGVPLFQRGPAGVLDTKADEMREQRRLRDQQRTLPFGGGSTWQRALGAFKSWRDQTPDAGDAMKDVLRETRGEADRNVLRLKHALEDSRKAFQGLDKKQVTQIVAAAERGDFSAIPSSQRDVMIGLQHIAEEDRLAVQKADPTKLEYYYEHYVPHRWKRNKVAREIMAQTGDRGRGLFGSKTFLQHRTLFPPTFAEGVSIGLEPRTWNPVDWYLQSHYEVQQFLRGTDTVNRMKALGLVKMFRSEREAPQGWAKLREPFGVVRYRNENGEMVESGRYYAPAAAAHIFNNATSRGLFERFPLMDRLNRANQLMNGVQLGLSAFHAAASAANSAVGDLALGLEKALQGRGGEAIVHGGRAAVPGASLARAQMVGHEMMQEYLDPGSAAKYAAEVNWLARVGGRPTQSVELEGDALGKIVDAFKRRDPKETARQALPAAMQGASAWLMKGVIPRLKLGTFQEMAANILKEAAENGHGDDWIRPRMQKAWDSIDNRYGQMIYDNLFWHRMGLDAARLGVRSVGWNLGSGREYLGGASDAARAFARMASRKRPEFSGRMAFTLATPIYFALATAAMDYLVNGKPPDKEKYGLRAYFYPEMPDGTLMSWPGYMKDWFAFGMHPMQTSLNKVSPLVNMVADQLSNKDYYGNTIRNEDDPLVKQLWESTEFAAKQFEPFSLRSFIEQRQKAGGGEFAPIKKDQSAGMSALAYLGFQPAPREIQNSPAMNLAQHYEAEYRVGTRTQEQAAKSRRMRDLVEAIREGTLDTSKLGGVTSRQFETAVREANEPEIATAVRRLSLEQALKVWQKASPSERQALEPVMAMKAAKGIEQEEAANGADAAQDLIERLEKAGIEF